MDSVGEKTSREPGCSHTVLGLPLRNERSEQKTVHGPPVQSRVAAAYRAVPAACATILAHMVMNGANEQQGQQAWGYGKGMAWQNKAVVTKRAGGEAGRHRPCSKTAGRRSDRHRPCSKTAGRRSDRHRPCSKNNSRQVKLAGLLSCSMEVGGGSVVVLATRKAGSDLPYCLPPNLSPLPVSVHAHSLNLQKPI